jgi:hypothetical protein
MSHVVLTFNPVDGMGLQCFMSEFEDWPQVRGYLAQLERRAVNELVHVVKEI